MDIQQEKLFAYCKAKNIVLNDVKKTILISLLQEKKALSAYDIIDFFSRENKKVHAMTIYRALNLFIEAGIVHRIERLNAFSLCCFLGNHEFAQWLICQKCGDVVECCIDGFESIISDIEVNKNFRVTSPVVELLGYCESCYE